MVRSPAAVSVPERFSVERPLGAGAFGSVFVVWDREREQRVALKRLERADPGSIYRFKQEFRALSEVAHENLVVLHELFADDDHCLFTMELVLGEPFDRHVRPMMSTGMPALNEARLRDALPQLARGVSAIHGGGKLHRDLKPSNVLVTPDGRVVIVDFELGKLPVGPPDEHKIAPEQARREMEAAGYAQCRSYDGLPHQYMLTFAPKC